MNNLQQYDDFINLLKELDSLLEQKNLNIEIKAIGGFATIYWAKKCNVKSRGSSQDIDTLTNLPADVSQLVSLVAKKHNVPNNWLNNEWFQVTEGKDEFLYLATWTPITDVKFKRIVLLVLDAEILFFFKMRALDNVLNDTEKVLRQQDVLDIITILEIFDEHDIYNIKNSRMRSCIEYFPAARDYMAGREPEIKKAN